MDTPRRYIPALHFDWLTSLYDPLLKWGFQESRFKRQLIEQAQIQRGQRVLDLGCGTGTLLLLIKQAHPEVEVVGLDVNPKILEIARKKAVQAHQDRQPTPEHFEHLHRHFTDDAIIELTGVIASPASSMRPWASSRRASVPHPHNPRPGGSAPLLSPGFVHGKLVAVRFTRLE